MKSQNIVDVIKFLLSKKSKYINGQNIIIDGGISLVWQEVIGRKYANIKTKVTQ
jgi:NAD(P)-dependent dehydrogenase (short-subunit alcohol dehydrogenase family)